jgi:hypothetical protein
VSGIPVAVDRAACSNPARPELGRNTNADLPNLYCPTVLPEWLLHFLYGAINLQRFEHLSHLRWRSDFLPLPHLHSPDCLF